MGTDEIKKKKLPPYFLRKLDIYDMGRLLMTLLWCIYTIENE